MIGPHSVDDWLALEPPVDGSRVELIYGHLYMTPPPGGPHQAASLILAIQLRDALRRAGRTDLRVVQAVGVRISTVWRTALIPDLVVLTTPPVDTTFDAKTLALAVEIWSPGNSRAERETKCVGYAAAGVPFLWTIERGNFGVLTLTACRLSDGHYVAEQTLTGEDATTITVAPVPVDIDLSEIAAELR